jgi:DNA-binding NarL/FixJ family response regulator
MRELRRVARALIAEDHPIFAAALRVSLATRWKVLCVADGARVPEFAARFKPELVLLDLTLPNLSGIALVRATRKAAPVARLLVVNGVFSRHLAESCLANGAHGFVAKTATLAELLAAVHAILSGSRPIILGQARSYAADRAYPRHPELSTLPPRLRQVLELIGQGLNARRIATRLGIGERTVEHYRSEIRHRLHVRNPAQLYRLALSLVDPNETVGQHHVTANPGRAHRVLNL